MHVIVIALLGFAFFHPTSQGNAVCEPARVSGNYIIFEIPINNSIVQECSVTGSSLEDTRVHPPSRIIGTKLGETVYNDSCTEGNPLCVQHLTRYSFTQDEGGVNWRLITVFQASGASSQELNLTAFLETKRNCDGRICVLEFPSSKSTRTTPKSQIGTFASDQSKAPSTQTSTAIVRTSEPMERTSQRGITETTSNLQTPKETPSFASPKITENSKGSGPDTTNIVTIVGPIVFVLACVGVLVTFIVVRKRRRGKMSINEDDTTCTKGRSRERSPDENHFFVLVDANEGPESHVGYNLSDLSEQAVNTTTNIKNSAGLH